MIKNPSDPNLELLLYYVLRRSMLIEKDFDERLDSLESGTATLDISVNNGQLIITQPSTSQGG